MPSLHSSSKKLRRFAHEHGNVLRVPNILLFKGEESGGTIASSSFARSSSTTSSTSGSCSSSSNSSSSSSRMLSCSDDLLLSKPCILFGRKVGYWGTPITVEHVFNGIVQHQLCMLKSRFEIRCGSVVEESIISGSVAEESIRCVCVYDALEVCDGILHLPHQLRCFHNGS